MVGVPGKSKGCSTCRRRKKGCDQKRPTCGQCESSGYVCGGYQRNLTFIPHPSTKSLEKAIFLPVRPAPPQMTAGPSLERSMIVTQCRSLFFEVFMPWGRCLCRDEQILRCQRPMNMTEVVPYICNDEISLDAAFSALTISRVGRNKGDLRLVKESTKFYGKALKNLQKSLVQPGRMQTEQVLAACLLLAYYEAFENVSGRSVGWASHVDGAGRVLQLRGPAAHTEGNAHLLFLGARVPILYSAMLRRKRTFMEERAWLEIPWSSLPHRSGIDLLVDVAVKIPGLLEDMDRLRALPPFSKQRNLLIECLTACMTTQQGLGVWEIRRKPSAAPIIKPHESGGPGDHYPFAHDIIFANHLFLQANLILWTAHLRLATTVVDLHLAINDLTHPGIENPHAVTVAQEQARQAATNIAQAIPYALLPDMGDLGIHHITFPMSLAYAYFSSADDVPVCAWLTHVASSMKHVGLNIDAIDKASFLSSTALGYEPGGSQPERRVSQGPTSNQSASSAAPSMFSLPSGPNAGSKSDHSKSTPWEPDFPSRFKPHSQPHAQHFHHHLPANEELSEGQSFSEVDIVTHHHLGGMPSIVSTIESNIAPDDFDPEYDMDSDTETADHPPEPSFAGSPAPLSMFSLQSQTGSRQHTVEYSTRGSRQASVSGPTSVNIVTTGVATIPKYLQQIQRLNASRGEYTFVEEDPSSYYHIVVNTLNNDSDPRSTSNSPPS